MRRKLISCLSVQMKIYVHNQNRQFSRWINVHDMHPTSNWMHPGLRSQKAFSYRAPVIWNHLAPALPRACALSRPLFAIRLNHGNCPIYTTHFFNSLTCSHFTCILHHFTVTVFVRLYVLYCMTWNRISHHVGGFEYTDLFIYLFIMHFCRRNRKLSKISAQPPINK